MAKGCWRVRIGKKLKVEQAAYRRSRPRWSVTSVLDLVHPMAPQGATRVGGRKSLRHTFPVPFRRLPPLVAGATTFPPLRGGTMGSGQGCQPVFLTRRRPGLPVFPRPTGRLPGFPSPLAHQLTSPLAHYRGFIKTGAAGAHHNPLNPLNLLNLLNPHAQRACPKSRSAALPMHSFFLIFQMFVYLSA